MHVGRRSDIEAACRIAGENQARLPRELARNYNLLLISAAQISRGQFRVRRHGAVFTQQFARAPGHRAMIEQMNEGAVALDASGLIVYCNA